MANRTNLTTLRVISVFLVVLGAAATAAGRTIYVDADASGANNGSSWTNAYRCLQNGLAVAWRGDEIRVAQGIYKPDEDSAHPNGSGSRTATFQLENGVAVKGGYAGFGQPDPNARDIEVYETILSGDLIGNDGPDFANNYENSYHVVTGSGTNDTAVLDGFTITAGNANQDYPSPYATGGGMYNYTGSPTVTNCTFSGNSAEAGGGMDNESGSLTVTNCTFSENSARWGGGMDNYNGSPTVTNCTFSTNSATTGGGMYNWLSRPTVTNCTFSGNSAGWSGGGMFNDSVSPTVTNCIFSGNSAEEGGGMSNYNGSPTLTNCTFNGNSADWWGGGLFNEESSPTLTNCTFSGNSAGSFGGGMDNYYSSATVTNCILWGNTAPSGPQINERGTGSETVSYSDVQGGWPGAGNINANPLFVDPANGDYHLLPGSPCIDAGDNSAVPPSVVTDLDGNPRIIDGTVDMGAYEGPYSGFLLSAYWVIVPEGGTATFTVAPKMDPLGTLEVTVAVESGDPDITVESGGLLTFDSSNYTQPQTVTLAAAEDADELHGSTVILVSAPGVYPAGVTAYELDSEGPTELYVDCDALGANDGSSWEDAFTELREGLSFAAGTFWVKKIRVAQGVYTPGDREATFRLKNGVAIKGGYAGFGEPDPNARDIDAYETILSGDLLGNDGPDFANNGENSYHVVTGGGTDATAVLDGFTITAGNANQDYPSPYANGGGMYNYTGSPTLTNCTFSENSAMHYGGGMFNGESSPTVTNCIFSGNSADYGSGMYNYQSSPTVTNCTFSGNSAETGGGMCNWENSSPTVTNCTFGGNSAMTYGGGMSNFDHSSPTVTNCVFSGNSAANYGHGGGMSNFDNSSPTVTNCTFSGNSAGWDGGGMFNYYSSPTLANCILWGNAAPSGPQIHNYGTSSATVSYSDVVGGWPGEGNIDADPRFGTPGAWEPIEETDMVSYWKFDGNADDTAGGNDGTVYGAQWTIGQLGGALDFDGAGDYVNCGNDSSLNPTNNFSISAWFNVDSACPIGTIVCKGDVPAYLSGGAYTILCVPMNGTLGFYVRGSSNAGFGYANAAVSVNEWTHVVGTFSDGNISIYKNGVFVANGVLGTSTINTNNGPLGIGAEGDGGMPFNGTIDDVAIHNRALSSEEIEQLYQIGLSGHSYYHLLPDSPCINAGDPNYVAEPNETDLDGKPRVIGGRIDMGAYEYPNTTPVACIVGGDRIVECEGCWGARVALDGSCSSDADSTPGTNDDIVSFDWYKVDACDPNFEDFLGSGEIIDCNLPLGEHIIVLEVTDKAGAFDTIEITIIVQDTTPPDFTLSVTPTMLWPANHKMVLIMPSWTASDICDASPEVSLVSITMNEGDEAIGDGHTTNDIQIGDDGSIYLRAERSGTGSGRIYTITYQAVDDSGNVTVKSAIVTVPHDQR